MALQSVTPGRSESILRIGDSDDLIVMEYSGVLTKREIRLERHGIIVLVTDGTLQLDYDGQPYQLARNDLFLYMRGSAASHFLSSEDFSCRQIWFTESELWNINKFSDTGLPDLVFLKQHPTMHLSDADATLMDSYFSLLCSRMRSNSLPLQYDIVRSLVSAMMQELLCMKRREEATRQIYAGGTSSNQGKLIAERFMELVQQAEGRVRRVDEFARMLNITPKYLSRLLMQAFGRHPHEVIDFFTIKAIENRLRFTNMTMQQVADDLDFPNASFFGRYFREHVGISPKAFRKKYQ